MKNKAKQLFILFTLLIVVLGGCAAQSNTDRVVENQQNSVTNQQKDSLETEVLSHSIESVHVSEKTSKTEDANQENAIPENLIQESSEPVSSEVSSTDVSQLASDSTQELTSQHSELSYEDFQGFYVTFVGEIYNSRPETIIEILPGEVRIGWPESEYIPHQVVGHTINGNIMTVQTNEIGLNSDIVGQHTFEFNLDISQDNKILSSNGIENYAISLENYIRLIEHSYTY